MNKETNKVINKNIDKDPYLSIFKYNVNGVFTSIQLFQKIK